MKDIIKIISIIASLTIIPSILSAELITITCDFYTFSAPGKTGKCSSTDMKDLRFVVDTNTQTGKLLGNAGSSDLLVVEGEDTITLMQLYPIVTTTTVQLSTLKVVHSRNVVLVGEFIPTQYYGKAISIE